MSSAKHANKLYTDEKKIKNISNLWPTSACSNSLLKTYQMYGHVQKLSKPKILLEKEQQFNTYFHTWYYSFCLTCERVPEGNKLTFSIFYVLKIQN